MIGDFGAPIATNNIPIAEDSVVRAELGGGRRGRADPGACRRGWRPAAGRGCSLAGCTLAGCLRAGCRRHGRRLLDEPPSSGLSPPRPPFLGPSPPLSLLPPAPTSPRPVSRPSGAGASLTSRRGRRHGPRRRGRRRRRSRLLPQPLEPRRLLLAAAPLRRGRDQQGGGEQSGQPSEVAPSHTVDQTEGAVRPPPSHGLLSAPGRGFAPPPARGRPGWRC